MQDNWLLAISILVLLCGKLGIAQELDPDYSFTDFVRQFNKNYDQTQYETRKVIFNENYQKLKELEDSSNGNCHYEVNQMLDLTEEQRAKKKGYSHSNSSSKKPDNLSSKIKSKLGNALGLPNSLNYKELGKVSPVKNQQSCGSCWAFSTVAAYQSYLLIERNQTYDLSEQYVLDCTSSGNCIDGGFPDDAIDMFVGQGIPLESAFPYTSSDQAYNNICSASDKIKLNTPVLSTPHYYSVSDDQLKEILYNYGPVSVGIYTNFAFDYYSNGIFDGCPLFVWTLNHAVLLVGYTSEGNWIIKNSWGTNWGESGYMIVDKDKNCGLTQYVDLIEVQWQQNENTQVPEEVEYKVELSDSQGDGWNGNTIGIRQNGVITSVFGSQFKSGSSYGPITLKVKKNVLAELVVVSISSYTKDIGFSVYNENNTQIYSRCAGASFSSDIIFHKWCPGNACLSDTNFELHIMMMDLWGDGWNNNVFGLEVQGKIIGTFGQTFQDGHTSDPLVITVKSGIQTKIVVDKIGKWRSEISFTISDSQLNELFARQPGTMFYADTIIGEFCPGCINQAGVKTLPISGQMREKRPITDPNDVNYIPETQGQFQKDRQNLQQETGNKVENLALILISSVLGFFLLFFMVVSIVLFTLWWRQRKQIYIRNNNSAAQGQSESLMSSKQKGKREEEAHVIPKAQPYKIVPILQESQQTIKYKESAQDQKIDQVQIVI